MVKTFKAGRDNIKIRDFGFWFPLENITKAKDKTGKDIMRVGGIASTMDEDADGEFLDPKGFDLDYLKRYGIINWHHQQKGTPAAIIGEPHKAEIRKGGLYLEADLYPNSKMAKEVYELAQTFQKDSKTRRLGFSIEGKVTERDALDKNIVRKAKITGVAITHMPKNPKTFLDVIKGNIDDDFVPTMISGKAAVIPEGTQYIADVENDNGKRIKVDIKGNVTISKSTDIANIAPLKLESIDKVKPTKKKKKKFTKAETFEKLFHDFPAITIEKATKIYNLIQKIQRNEKK